MSRETRLLGATIVVSALVLLTLSRFRFPERAPLPPVPVAPLERLAARTGYDELSGIVAGLASKLSPNLVVLRVAADGPDGPRMLADALKAGAPEGAAGHVAALRVGETTAIATLPAGSRILGLPGDDPRSSARLLATDPVRRLALVRVPPDAGGARTVGLGELGAPAYVVVAEGTRAGLTFRPVFVGSSDRFIDPRWDMPLVAVSSVALTSPGALVFSVQGEFLGSAVTEAGTLAIAPAREIVTAADALSALGPRGPFDAGIAVQPLSAPLAAALGVDEGVVIAEVDERGPAARLLEPADVVTTINGRRVASPDDLLLRLARQMPGRDLSITLVRGGETRTLALNAQGAPPAPPPPSPQELGLQTRRGAGTLVTSVAPGTAAEAAGLEAGDIITRFADLERPTSAQVSARLKSLPAGSPVVLTIERAGRRRLVVLGGAETADASR